MTGNTPFTIRAEALGKRYNREWIFRNLSYTFTSGNIYAITGPNGSGKSTLLQLLWGQLPPSAGTIEYSREGTTVPVEDVYQYVSIATPYLELIEEFTLREQLEFHFRLRAFRNGHTIDSLIETLYLKEARNKAIAHFSSGMRQRLKLGMAFYTDSPVLFLDEPGTNLDAEAFAWYKVHLELAATGRLVLIASNQPAEYPESTQVLNMRDWKKAGLQ